MKFFSLGREKPRPMTDHLKIFTDGPTYTARIFTGFFNRKVETHIQNLKEVKGEGAVNHAEVVHSIKPWTKTK